MPHALVGTIGARAMLAAFEALGLDRRRLQEQAGLGDATLADPDALLPADAFYAMWELADRAWGRPGLGLHAAERVPFGAYEVLDYLLLTSRTVGEALRHLARYIPLMTRTAGYEIGEHEDHAECEMVWRVQPAGVMFHLRDFSLALVCRRVAHASGRHPETVELAGPPLASAEEYADVFASPVVLRSARNLIIFSAAAWRAPLERRDDDLNRTLERHARLLLERQPAHSQANVAEEVRAELLRSARLGLASMDDVAARLAMSARTLQRRLRDEGTTFDEVSREVRAGLAREYLADPGLNITEAAYLLGFSEPSAFSRAFRRWTGRSPQAFRARLLTARR